MIKTSNSTTIVKKKKKIQLGVIEQSWRQNEENPEKWNEIEMIEVENLDEDDSPFSHTREEFRRCKKREKEREWGVRERKCKSAISQWMNDWLVENLRAHK